MKLEDQVCSLELAKKLLTLGVKQKFNQGNLCYTNSDCLVMIMDCADLDMTEVFTPGSTGYPFSTVIRREALNCRAFTVAELGEMLPNAVRIDNSEPFENFRIFTTRFYSITCDMRKVNNFVINYECDTTEATGINGWMSRKLTKNVYDPNEANARAKMLIYLLENKLMELPT